MQLAYFVLMQMKGKQKLECFSLDFPITIDFSDLDTVSQVVKEILAKETKKIS